MNGTMYSERMVGMIDWKRKLTSRKFWVALVGFITALLVAFQVDNGTIEQIISIVMAFATLITYILAEGFVDGNTSDDSEVY